MKYAIRITSSRTKKVKFLHSYRSGLQARITTTTEFANARKFATQADAHEFINNNAGYFSCYMEAVCQQEEKKMSKRYYTEISKYTSRETVVLDSKRAYVEFAVFCEDESHADALVKELNRRGYEIGEFHAIMIAVDLKVKS